MKKTVLFAILLLVCLTGKSQQGSLEAYGGGIIGSTSIGSFKDFAESYNSYLGSSVEKELPGLGFGMGYQYGLLYKMDKKVNIGLSLSYLSLYSRAAAELDDGSKRIFRHQYYTPLNGGVFFRNNFLELHVHLGFSQAELESVSKYPDGFQSYGKERTLNGVYKTFGLFAGADLSFHVPLSDRLSVRAGASVNGVSGSDYNDPNWFRDLDLYGIYTDYLPTEYGEYMDLAAQNNLTEYDFDTKVVKLKGIYYYAFINLNYKIF